MKFTEYLKSLNFKPDDYLKIAKNTAKKYGYEFLSLSFSDKDKYKLKILDPLTRKYIYFGANGYKDYIIYKHLYNKAYADKKAFNYHSRAFNIYSKSDKYSPSVLSYIILW
jgi:hypothetical protein